MKNSIIEKQKFKLSEVDSFCTKRDWLLLEEDARIAVKMAVRDVIKKIEDSKLSQLGITIEELKKRYE